MWDEQLQCYRLNSTAWNDGDGEKEDAVILSAGWQSDRSLYHPSSKVDLPSARELAEMHEEEAEMYLEELASSTNNQLAPPKDLWDNMKGCSVVQHPGEMLLIPPYWYHQTYAPEPSLAVASQRCGSRLDATRVVGHVLSLQQESQSLPQPIQNLLERDIESTNVDPQETVNLLFGYLGNQNNVR